MKLKKLFSGLLAGVMLAGSALVSAPAFADEPLPFEDVKADAWYYDAVADVYEAGLMKGKTDTKFDPSAPMSRAEFVTVLSRLAAINAANYGYADELNFNDTDPDAWYADAAGWAVETGLSTGTSATTFSPTREITRQEMAVLIVRFVKYLGETVPDNSKVDKFADANKIADWATTDIETMRKYGFVQGDQNGNFNPEGKADRASVATIAMRLLPYVTTTDVVENGKSDYVIVADEAAKDAADRLQYQVEYTTGVKLDIVESSNAKKAIVLKAVDDDKLGSDGYEIKADGETITVTGDTSEGIYKGAVRFILRATFDNNVKFTSAANDRYEFKYPIGKLTINGNDISKYTILYPENASAQTMIGVNDLIEYIEKACGVKLEAKVGTSGDYAIIVKEAAVKVGNDGNENDNFSVKTEGNNVILTGGAARGAMYACYDFLEDVIGWAFLTETQDYLSPVEDLDVKDLDYSEATVFEHRSTNWCLGNISDTQNKHKLWGIRGGGHSFQALTDGAYDQTMQPCLSDPKIYDQMLGNVMKILEANPNVAFVDVSQNDNDNYCKCDDCMATYAKYTFEPGNERAGGTSGQMIEFVNRIAAEVEKKYPDVMVHTFAYMYTRHIPQGIKPADNVSVQLCSLECCFAHPLYSANGNCNESFAEDIAEWSKITKNLDIWDYTTNFTKATVPFSNIKYEVLAGNMRLFADNNAFSVFEQGNHCGAKERGEFDRLRAYIIAKLLWNPYMSEEEYNAHIKKFMEGYFGDGWQLVYEATNLWLETDKSCHHIFEDSSPRVMAFYKISSQLVDLFDKAELHAESIMVFDNIDLTQIQFNYMDQSVMFKKLSKSDDPDDKALIQKLSKDLQDKMLKFGVSLGNMSLSYPNFTEFSLQATEWTVMADEGEIVYSLSDVTVDYPKLTYAR